MSDLYDLSIVTAVYNRNGLFIRQKEQLESLRLNQMRVEWIVVDDGSDNSPLENFHAVLPNGISFKSFIKKNGGKHTAINLALEKLCSRYSLFLDSDDFITNDQLRNIEKFVLSLTKESLGVVGLNRNISGELIGHLPKYFGKNSIFEIRGDYSRLVRTDVLKKYRFDYFEGEKFTTEMNFWAQVHSTGRFSSTNLDFVTVEYQQNGLSSRYPDLLAANPKSVVATIQRICQHDYKFLSYWKFAVYHLNCISADLDTFKGNKNIPSAQRFGLIALQKLYSMYKKIF